MRRSVANAMRAALAAAFVCTVAAVEAQTAKKAETPPKPVIGLSVNYSAEAQVVKGWPALVRVRIFHPQRSLAEKRPAFVISSLTGAWTDAVKLKVTTANSADAKWKFELAGDPPNPSVQIGGNESASAEWKLTAEQTRFIPAGQYTVQALLAEPEGGGWHGAAASLKVSVKVAEAPLKLSETQQYLKALLTVDTAGENLNAAWVATDTFNHAYPRNVSGMALKAGILERQGKIIEARNVALQALQAYEAQTPRPKEPPIPLIVLFRRLNGKVLLGKAPALAYQ